MAQIVRQSKFRHVFCKPVKHESCMSDIRVTEITWDSLFCDVNPKFIAFINRGAGGPFMVVPVNKIGRIDKDYPFVDAHKAPCLEIAWSPFNDNVIASCSEDTTCKVWVIPDRGLSRNLSEPAVELTGHQKRVNTIAWHPVANNVLLTAGGENVMFMWNVGTGEALLEISGHPDQIWSINFNYDGSQFVTTCKDKKIRILDSHSGEVLHEGTGHEGLKPQRAIFVKDGLILTTGFTKRSERLYALRAPEDLSTPIVEEELDTSNGVLFPFYDEDAGLVYLCGKGDCAIRYYEVNNEAPFVHYINTYTTSEPQRAIGFQSKRGITSEENEINRIYKLTTKGVVDILQFFVPRKSDLFQHDLYPDTRSTIPALTAEEFMEGKNSAPNRQPVNAAAAAAAAKPKVQVAKKANILSTLAPTAAETVQPQSYAERPTSQASAASPRPSASPRPRPVVDDDMGIVTMREAPPSRPASSRASRTEIPPREENKPDPMKPKQAVTLKSRGDRDGADGAMTPGQKRAAAELERIKRNQTATADEDTLAPPPQPRASASPRGSVSSEHVPQNMDELLEDLMKMKAVLRQHERRIRMLEEVIADSNMSNAYSF
uniref:Coronin n=1 Tax=Caenorhabditis japonica TaxID=281687 RepID=A0A8R1I6P8_CAEJA